MKAALLYLLLLLPCTSYAADQGLVMKILACESSFRHNVWGDKGKSYGIAQFRKETFYEFAAMARKKMRKAKMYEPNWYDPQQQVFLLNWGLDNGYGRRWTCYRTIQASTAKLDVTLLPQLSSPPPGPGKAKLLRELADFKIHPVIHPLWLPVKHPYTVVSQRSWLSAYVNVVVFGIPTSLPRDLRACVPEPPHRVGLVLLSLASPSVIDKQPYPLRFT